MIYIIMITTVIITSTVITLNVNSDDTIIISLSAVVPRRPQANYCLSVHEKGSDQISKATNLLLLSST